MQIIDSIILTQALQRKKLIRSSSKFSVLGRSLARFQAFTVVSAKFLAIYTDIRSKNSKFTFKNLRFQVPSAGSALKWVRIIGKSPQNRKNIFY